MELRGKLTRDYDMHTIVVSMQKERREGKNILI